MRHWIALIFPLLMLLAGKTSASPQLSQTVQTFCADCHGADKPERGLNLVSMVAEPIEAHPEAWEKVVRRLRGRQMPPAGEERPTEEVYIATLSPVETALDRVANQHPNPGRTDTIRRLTRTEYQNAIRDLLAVEIDATALLPPDESSHGFDNITVGNLS